MILSAGAIDLGEAYLIYAKGNANISIWDNRQAYITSQTYDPTTNTLTAVANLPENSTSFILVFENTTGPGLQDLAVLQPGYDLSAKSNGRGRIRSHIGPLLFFQLVPMNYTSIERAS